MTYVEMGDVEMGDAPKPKNPPDVSSDLPHAFRAGRPLYPKEVAYLREIFQDSLDYDKIRITRDHWISYGSTRVVGNTIHLTSQRGGVFLFEDTPEQALNQAGLDLIGHEAMHVWQFQNGGWAYIGSGLPKQLAGYYATGSRNTAYDWRMAVKWEIPWEQWGTEQQAQVIDQWNLATRGRLPAGSDPEPPCGSCDPSDLIETAKPYLEKVRRGEGAPQFSVPGTVVACAVLGGLSYLAAGASSVKYGVTAGVLLNLPWNGWAKQRERALARATAPKALT